MFIISREISALGIILVPSSSLELFGHKIILLKNNKWKGQWVARFPHLLWTDASYSEIGDFSIWFFVKRKIKTAKREHENKVSHNPKFNYHSMTWGINIEKFLI